MDVKESRMVRPMGETPSGSVWLSSLDLVMPATHHTRTIYLYVSSDGAGAANFFDSEVLKAALGRALVEFYPYAGRLGKADDGRMEIKCNAEGVLFVEAHLDATLQDMGGLDLTLVPKVDYSQGISSFPLLLLQISRFKCGGVCLGVANEHHISDGISALHFINTWSDMARGISAAAVPPFLERRLLSARHPPQPQFPHEEYQPPPPRLPVGSGTSHSTFQLTPDLVNALKRTCKAGYTSYEVVAGHVWRCVCIARGLPPQQETKLQIPVDGRVRLQPPLPPGFFGNGIFYTTSSALCGDLASKPLEFAVEKVHAALLQMNDDYLRSALDYLELRLPNICQIARTENNVSCPNFGITTWVRLPFYEADFGWGNPVYAGPAAHQFEGKALLFLGAHKNLLLAITLLTPHMDAFHNLLYHI